MEQSIERKQHVYSLQQFVDNHKESLKFNEDKRGSNMQNMCEYAVVGYKKGDNVGPVIFNWKGKQSYLK